MRKRMKLKSVSAFSSSWSSWWVFHSNNQLLLMMIMMGNVDELIVCVCVCVKKAKVDIVNKYIPEEESIQNTGNAQVWGSPILTHSLDPLFDNSSSSICLFFFLALTTIILISTVAISSLADIWRCSVCVLQLATAIISWQPAGLWY